MTSTSRRRLLDLAADRAAALSYRVWGFGEGPALLGLVAAGELLDRPDLVNHITQLVDPTLTAPPSPDQHLVAVEVLHRLPVDSAAATESWVRCLTTAPRPVPGRPAVHRPDLVALDRLIWVDCMHTDGPGLALARPELAAPIMQEYVAALQDGTGLFSHGYDVLAGRANGVHWGRGQGWALWGLVGTLAAAPDPTLEVALAALLDALARHEHDGQWTTIVDAGDRTPVELSVSALVAAGVLAGQQAGVVGARWSGLADRALAAAVAAADGTGVLPVSEATPVGSPVTYLTRRTGCHPWGQGPLLLALAAAEGWQPFPKERLP